MLKFHRSALRNLAAAKWLRPVPGALCSFAVLAGLVLQTAIRTPGSKKTGAADAQPAIIQDSQQSAISDSPVEVVVDATQPSAPDAATLTAVCDKLRLASGVVPECLLTSSQSANGERVLPTSPDWFLWARLDGKRSECAISGSNSGSIQAYSVHCESGAAVCLVNSGAVRGRYILRTRLPGGVFRVEKLSFVPALQAQNQKDAADNPVPSVFFASLNRLEGRDLSAAGVISKPGELYPGEVAIIRYTDVARASREALLDLKTQLHSLAESSPGPAARLRRIIHEGDAYAGCISAGCQSAGQKRLNSLHRLILLVSQAESLHRNYQERKSINAEPGARTMGALERAADSLAETSGVLTGLIPQIRLVGFNSSQPPGNDSNLSNNSNDSKHWLDGAAMLEVTATVSVKNTGQHSVNAVKLGLDSASLPAGAVCTPDDPAYFGTLAPGQSAQAVFKLKLPSTAESLPARCVADVSYFTAGAPAHLRTRPW